MSREKPTPPFLIRFARRQRTLRVQVTGLCTLENTVAYWKAIVDESQRVRPGAILLVDELQGEPLAETDWKRLVEAMAGHGLESVKIAHVKPAGLQKIEHCELYAREAGFHARVFDDERMADLWLRYGET